MRKAFPFSRPRPAPSDRLKRSDATARSVVRVVAVRHHHRRHDGAVFVGALARDLESPGAHRRARRLREPAVPREHVLESFLASIRSASRRPKSRFVDGVYGKKPLWLEASIGSHDQYDRARRAAREAASAFSLIALKLRPGGSISPFCDPASVTSIPHSSWRRSIDPSDDTASTSSSARAWPRPSPRGSPAVGSSRRSRSRCARPAPP